jgi:hypothetical protein
MVDNAVTVLSQSTVSQQRMLVPSLRSVEAPFPEGDAGEPASGADGAGDRLVDQD